MEFKTRFHIARLPQNPNFLNNSAIKEMQKSQISCKNQAKSVIIQTLIFKEIF